MAELQQQPPPEGTINGGLTTLGASSENPLPNLGSKRQRRPSVRLGDIGEQPATLSYESYMKRSKQWNPDSKFRNPSHPHKDLSGKASKTRPLTNLSNGGGDSAETLVGDEEKNPSEDGNLELGVVGNRRVKDFKNKRGGGGGLGGGGTKRVRSNWGSSKVDEGGVEGDERFSEDGEEWYRDFDQAGSESPLKEQSVENTGQASDRVLLVGGKRERRSSRQARVRVPEYRDHDAVELDGLPSDNDAREWKSRRTSVEMNNGERGMRSSFLEDGVQSWLNGLGLGRYAPVFEIHEVDEEVLPLLTLEDLRDMGVSAVGSRRKMYCAIQKLAKGFT